MYDNDNSQASVPLDSTTARIVSELASRLVPELTQALASITPAESVSGEALNNLQASLQAGMESLTQMSEVLSKSAVGSIPQELTREMEEMRQTLTQMSQQLHRGLEEAGTERKEVLNAVVILTEAITSLRAQRVTPRPEPHAADHAALDKLERLIREGTEAERAGRQAMLQPISSMVDELVTIRGQISDASNTLRILKSQGQAQGQGKSLIEQIRALWEEGPAGQRNEVSAALMELSGEVAALGKRTSEALEKLSAPDTPLAKLLDGLPNWEGLLRAHGQAQTHELDTLSQELSALQKESGATLFQTLREALSQEFAARDKEWEARLNAEHQEAARRMGAVKKALWALAGIGLLTLAAAAAHFVNFIR
ncbi:MAG: hypothetical protein K6E38_09010 [Fretibacterium sp.]|nr:hypothetical protein [Fretibacterium sp.]